MDLMELYKPEIFLAIADGRTALNEGYKRVLKSLDRSCNMFDTCVRRYKASKLLQNSALVGMYNVLYLFIHALKKYLKTIP